LPSNATAATAAAAASSPIDVLLPNESDVGDGDGDDAATCDAFGMVTGEQEQHTAEDNGATTQSSLLLAGGNSSKLTASLPAGAIQASEGLHQHHHPQQQQQHQAPQQQHQHRSFSDFSRPNECIKNCATSSPLTSSSPTSSPASSSGGTINDSPPQQAVISSFYSSASPQADLAPLSSSNSRLPSFESSYHHQASVPFESTLSGQSNRSSQAMNLPLSQSMVSRSGAAFGPTILASPQASAFHHHYRDVIYG